jgi:hypothetical protein
MTAFFQIRILARWMSIHSDISKLLFPVSASNQENPLKLLFQGKLPQSIIHNWELVTQGRISDE